MRNRELIALELHLALLFGSHLNTFFIQPPVLSNRIRAFIFNNYSKSM